MGLLRFAIGVCVGLIVARIVAGKRAGGQGLIPSIRFTIGNYIIHIHHWLLAAIAGGLLWSFRYTGDFTYGFIAGVFVQGLTYRDFYRTIYRKTAA